MSDITCPHCNQIFEMDAAGYASIVQQVRGSEFEDDLHRRLTEAEQKHKVELQLAEAKMKEKKKC